MKIYPSIPYYTGYMGRDCIAFVKYDGSNLRFEWSRKKAWHKYGTRKHLFDHTHREYGQAVSVFEKTLAEPVERVLRENKAYRGTDHAVVFAEYFGPNSFAGHHAEGDPMELVLFDVNPHKKGFVSPRDFVRDFGHISHAAEVVHEGVLDEEFVAGVIGGAYPIQEGVVCKGGSSHSLWAAKVKTAEWVSRVKARFPTDWGQVHDQEE